MQAWIVVPCYNEETRLDSGAFEAWIDGNPEVGFILVNDGSRDGTVQKLRTLAEHKPGRVDVIDQQPNQGKAEAVRVGMLRAMDKGAPFAGYWDADLATPLEEIPLFIHCLTENPKIEIVLGARIALLGRVIERKAHRHYLGRIFATAASQVLALPVYDTQCGAKLFRVSDRTRRLFKEPFGSRWIFDVEWLARYRCEGGPRESIFEMPVRSWKDVGESRVKPTDFLKAIGEMAAIHRKYPMPGRARGLLGLLFAPFVHYVGVGGIGTALHYLTLTLLVELRLLRPTIATVVGAAVGAMANYALNYYLTFASKEKHSRTLPRFLVIALLSAFLSGAGMWVLTGKLHAHYLLAQILCTVVILVVGFVLNKTWTFGSSKVQPVPVKETGVSC